MVKPTSSICCEFAQKHGAEFVQNFFEKLLDKFAWQVHNGIVPGTTGTKKHQPETAEKRLHMYIDTNRIVASKGPLPTSAVTGAKMARGAEMAFISAKDAPITVDAETGRISYHTNSRIFIEREFVGNKTVTIPAGNPLESDKTAPVKMRVTLNWTSPTTWATRLILMDYGFNVVTNATFEIETGCNAVYRFIKANTSLDIVGVEIYDIKSDDPYKGKWADTEKLHKWVNATCRKWHNSAIVETKPTK